MRIIKATLVFVTVWIVLAVIGNVIGRTVFENGWFEYMTVSGRGVRAVVIKKEPENHQTLTYRYSVAGNEYSGVGHGGDENPPFDKIAVGDEIMVYYDADDPSRSIAGNPWEDFYRNQSVQHVLTIVFPLFPMASLIAIYMVVNLLKRQKRTSGATSE